MAGRRALCSSLGLALSIRRTSAGLACRAAGAALPGGAPCPALQQVQQWRSVLPWVLPPGLPWPAAARGLQTPAGGGGSNSSSSTAGAQGLLDSLQAAKLRDDLAVLGDDKPYITYQELLEFIKANNAADSDAEAEERANALMRAGVILRLNSIVYLRPQEIAEMVYRVVPTDPAEARRRLAENDAQLAAMEQEHLRIQRAARRWPRFWLQAGCVGLFTQLAGMAYLTWWELSWDVMEPVAYMLSLTYSFLGYLYFVSRGSVLDYGPFLEHWTSQQLRKKMSEQGFDLDRYSSLMRQTERYRRYLAAQAEAERAGNKIT